MIIADTGFWVALANRKDKHNAAAKRALKKNDRLITTWPVITETCHLLAARGGHQALDGFVAAYELGAFEVFELGRDHAPRLRHLLKKYADLPADLADVSLVLLAEHLGHGDILTTDLRDFGVYRFKDTHPFRNVLTAK